MSDLDSAAVDVDGEGDGLFGFVADAWEDATAGAGDAGAGDVSVADQSTGAEPDQWGAPREDEGGGGFFQDVAGAFEEGPEADPDAEVHGFLSTVRETFNEAAASAVPDPLHVESLGGGAFRLSFPPGVDVADVESWLFSSGTAPDLVSLEEEAAQPDHTSFGAYGVSLSGMVQELRSEAYGALVSAWPESYEDRQRQNETDDRNAREARAAYEEWEAMPNAIFGTTNGKVMSDPQFEGAHELGGKFIWIGYTSRGKAMQIMDVPDDEGFADTVRWYLFEEGKGKSLRDAVRANREDWLVRVQTVFVGMM